MNSDLDEKFPSVATDHRYISKSHVSPMSCIFWHIIPKIFFP